MTVIITPVVVAVVVVTIEAKTVTVIVTENEIVRGLVTETEEIVNENEIGIEVDIRTIIGGVVYENLRSPLNVLLHV